MRLQVWAYLAHSAVPACLHVVFALVAGVDKAVLALGMQLHQHAQCRPLGPPKGRELPVLVPGEGEEGITAIHEVTAEQGVRVNDRGQRIDDRSCMEVDHKEHLQEEQQDGVSSRRAVIRAGPDGPRTTSACRTETVLSLTPAVPGVCQRPSSWGLK